MPVAARAAAHPAAPLGVKLRIFSGNQAPAWAKAINGEMRFRVRCRPRFDYGRAGCRVERREGCYVLSSDGDDGTVVHLRSEVPLSIGDGEVSGEFTLRAGESAGFVLEDGSGGFDTPCRAEDYVADSFKNTLNFWRRWIGRCTYHGRWREMVYRSALVLKLLVSQPHGSIVAAPTFGLPETIGGGRNWDYRYTWIRDASFTLYALIRLGMTQETGDFIVLLDCGLSRMQALALNVASSLTAVVGGIVGYYALSYAESATPYLLSLAAASFIYIAVADLIPGLHRASDTRSTAWQVSLIAAGIAAIALPYALLHQH